MCATEETDAQLATLAEATVALMLGVIGPLGDLLTTLPVGPEHPGRSAGPSFELFYENDYLMPHRGAAWALLEERLREAARFCDETGSGEIASALAPVTKTLTGVADSLAAHFGDWGAESRFVTRGDGAAVTAIELPGHGDPVAFEQHIKPLFRERDRRSMRFAFDLSAYADVAAQADAILQRLEDGTMPCDGAWPAERVAVFRRWIEAGKPA